MELFDTYRIVMLGEIHECRQEHELLRKLIAARDSAKGLMTS